MVFWSVIDTETTGIVEDDYAISLGTLVVDIDHEEGIIECIDSMYSLICIPDPLITKKTQRIHGISPENIMLAPSPLDVCSQYLKLESDYRFMHVAAWNHLFDRRFMEKLFNLAGVKLPALQWEELQPKPYAKLDKYVPLLECEYVRSLSGHHALNDCARALSVYAEHNGYDVDVLSLTKVIQAYK
jgi:DNA polymerase III epsilon subunit-like protein